MLEPERETDGRPATGRETTMGRDDQKTLSKVEYDRLMVLANIGREAEEKKKASLLGKKEKAALVRAKRAVIRDKARKLNVTCSVEEARAWIASHPPTLKKTK
jgi:hypothetical protein